MPHFCSVHSRKMVKLNSHAESIGRRKRKSWSPGHDIVNRHAGKPLSMCHARADYHGAIPTRMKGGLEILEIQSHAGSKDIRPTAAAWRRRFAVIDGVIPLDL